MLTCRELTELVTDYIEGQMSLWERVRFQLHLGMCRSCRDYVRQLEITAETLGRVPPLDLPPDVETELRRRFAAWKTDRDSAPGRGGPLE